MWDGAPRRRHRSCLPGGAHRRTDAAQIAALSGSPIWIPLWIADLDHSYVVDGESPDATRKRAARAGDAQNSVLRHEQNGCGYSGETRAAALEPAAGSS